MQRLKILIVDDDKTTLDVTSAVLEQRGHHVLKRENALGTTMAIMRQEPDVVLLDVHMPGLTGDRIAELVTPRKGRHAPIVILHSGSLRAELEQLAKRCGAAGIIEKTGDPFEFLRMFDRITANQRLNSRTKRSGPQREG